jgi:toxin ParE1/3/4
VKVTWSPLAIDRAVEEASFIARDKPGAAEKWLENLFEVVDRLESFPNSGRPVPELPGTRYRELIYGAHRIVFALEKTSVNILTVRRYRQILQVSDLEGAG